VAKVARLAAPHTFHAGYLLINGERQRYTGECGPKRCTGQKMKV
jgi:hypothetical protein